MDYFRDLSGRGSLWDNEQSEDFGGDVNVNMDLRIF